MEWLIVAAYLLIGLFIVAIMDAASHNDFDSTSIFLIPVWPILLIILAVVCMLSLVYHLGEKIGNLLGDMYDRM